MSQIYDIDQIVRDLRARGEEHTAAALTEATDERSRRLIRAQAELYEATIIQYRVLLALINEGHDEPLILTAFAVALGNIFATLVVNSPSPEHARETLLAGILDPDSFAPKKREAFAVKPVFGGRA